MTFVTASVEWFVEPLFVFLSARFSLSERAAGFATALRADFSPMVHPRFESPCDPVLDPRPRSPRVLTGEGELAGSSAQSGQGR
ncbi:protein of unknown function [Agreia sp. COWG]|nr:protein of unknown function [Agreia sp. COWG]